MLLFLARPGAPLAAAGSAGQDEDMVPWEYLIVALPAFDAPARLRGASPSVAALNHEGDQGWEAVGMTVLTGGTVGVLLKRPKER
jgi:hypothetical protein